MIWTLAVTMAVASFVSLQMKFGRICSPEASKCCAGFSLVGSIFFLWVAMMLTHQPLFVGGIEDLDKARVSAWGGMVLYIISFGIAMGYVLIDACKTPDQRNIQQRRRSGNEYEGLPTGSGPAVLQEYANSLELPQSITDGVFS